MTVDRSHLAAIADLFGYPEADFGDRVGRVGRLLDDRYPEAGVELRDFVTFAAHAGLDELEELYTRSFDVQSLTTLDIGYVVFGDDYKRGELLSNLSREFGAARVDCGTELADHLPNVLRWLAVAADDGVIREFVQEILHPALRRMVGEFDPERVQRKNELYRKHYRTLIEASGRATMYRTPLAALLWVIETDFGVGGTASTVDADLFLRVIDAELTVEGATSP